MGLTPGSKGTVVYYHPRRSTPIRNEQEAKQYCSQNAIIYEPGVFKFGPKSQRAGPYVKTAFLAHVQLPLTYEDTQQSSEKEEWNSAMNDELESIKEREVYSLVPRPKDTKIIGSRWVFAVKKDEQGVVQRFKARLVAQGYKQRKGIDYEDTYSPVVDFILVRLLLVIFLGVLKWKNLHLDVKCAYLYSTL